MQVHEINEQPWAGAAAMVAHNNSRNFDLMFSTAAIFRQIRKGGVGGPVR
jgi:hypothetical protein